MLKPVPRLFTVTRDVCQLDNIDRIDVLLVPKEFHLDIIVRLSYLPGETCGFCKATPTTEDHTHEISIPYSVLGLAHDG